MLSSVKAAMKRLSEHSLLAAGCEQYIEFNQTLGSAQGHLHYLGEAVRENIMSQAVTQVTTESKWL